jgi:hypothetical protein
MSLTPTPENPTPEFWENVLREAQSRARLVNVPTPETVQEARCFESAEQICGMVFSFLYTQRINDMRGIKADRPSRAFVRSYTGLRVERVLRILEAMQCPLLGHQDVPTLDFLLGPDGERWLAHHDGTVLRENNDEIAVDPAAPATMDGRITREEVWRIVAKRLAAVRDVLPGLAREPNKRRRDQMEAIKKLSPGLRAVTQTIRRAFPLASWDIQVLEALTKDLSSDVDALAREIDRQKKPPNGVQARTVVTQGLAEDFTRLTGQRAGGRDIPENSPFNRFVVAFFHERGYEFKMGTIGDRRENRVRKRKPGRCKG